MTTVRSVESTSGRKLVYDEIHALDRLNPGCGSAILVALEALERGDLGKALSGTKGLSEVKARHGPSIYRVLYAVVRPPSEAEKIVLLLVAFQKKTPKLPKDEQTKAEKRLKAFLTETEKK